MDQTAISNELQKYNITDAAISQLRDKYLALVVKDCADKKGYERVHEARMDIVKRRTSVEKTRKDLKAESLEYGRRVDAEAKRITALLEPIEAHLTDQEKIVTDELARLKAEKEAAEAARIQARVNRLYDCGARFDGTTYSAMGLMIPETIVKMASDDQFDGFCREIEAKAAEEAARIEAVEAARKAEEERLAKVAAEQEAERKRLEEIARQQAEEAARIKAEHEAIEREIKEAQEKVEAERKRLADEEAARLKKIEDEKRHAEEIARQKEELEKAKVEAAEKAKQEEAARIQREAEEKAEKERLAKIAAARKAAKAPDKAKILLIADALDTIQPPDVKTEDGKAVALSIMMSLSALIKDIHEKAEEL